MTKRRKTRKPPSAALQWRRSKGQRNWLDLPRDVVSAIFEKVGTIQVLTNVPRVCSQWRNVAKDPIAWRTIDMHLRGVVNYSDDIIDAMCRRAIDLSSGQLTDITIAFATNALLKYIADSTSHLRRLCIIRCYSITDEGLCVVAEKLPQLEELHISMSNLSKDSLETIGRSCPHLRTLKFNIKGDMNPHIELNEVAFAIAEMMPAIHNLQLVGNKLTNAGLLAILDGCPNLESLDLRQCSNLKLRGKLGRRCAQQIKDFRRPLDPIDDYLFGTYEDEVLSDYHEYLNSYTILHYDSADDH